MPRAKGGPKTRQRRKKILKKAKGYFGGRRKLYRTAAETVLRAGAFAYRGRKQKKRQARSLWIVRINAGCRMAGPPPTEARRGLEPPRGAPPPGARESGRPRPRRQQRLTLTIPGRRPPLGAIHPLTRVHDEIVTIFAGLGFSAAEGPEIETDYYNFEALNIPADHPARDMQDTFYLPGGLLLRTHTSPV